jgi:hypothetical protein
MKFLKYLRAVWRVALYEVRVMLFSLKFLILALLSWMFMDLYTADIRQFALDYEETLVPAQLPFYFSDPLYCNIAFLLLIFLFSDLPPKDSSQRQVLQRCGIRCYGTGQMLAIAILSVIYVVEQLLFSILTCIPCVEFAGWGRIWQSVASGKIYDLGYTCTAVVSQNVITNYLPWQAIGASALLFCLTGICYAMIEYLLNGVSRGKAGTAVLSSWSMAWIFLQGLAPHWAWVQTANRFSPQNWNDLAYKESGDVGKMAVRILLCILFLALLNQQLIKHRKIENV